MNICKNNANKHLSKPHHTPLHVSSSPSVILTNSLKQPFMCPTLYRLNSCCWGLNRYEVNALQLAFAQNSYLKSVVPRPSISIIWGMLHPLNQNPRGRPKDLHF